MKAQLRGTLRVKRWQDVISLLLGIWLFISPWLLGQPYLVQSVASVFWLIGAIVVVNSIPAAYRGSFREAEWINLIAGVVMFLVAINRQMTMPLMWDGVLVGIVLFILALWVLMDLRRL